jgi:putative transferase (TIGR04331 family)
VSERILLLSNLHVDSCICKPILFQRPEILSSLNNKKIAKLDFKIASPVGLENKVRWANWQITQKIESKLIAEITPILNEVHSRELNQRQWTILIGHWLRRFIQVVINRSNSLKTCYAEYKIASCTVQSVKKQDLAPANSQNAVELFSNDIWNEGLSEQIIGLLKLGNVNTRTSNYKINTSIENNLEPKIKLRNNIANFYNNQVFKLKRQTDNLFIATYLPIDVLIKLQLKLGELPALLHTNDFNFKKQYDSELRNYIRKKLRSGEYSSTTEMLIQSLLAYYIPMSYLENFNKYWSCAENCNWPKNPKNIMTSNCFDTNEKFKFYTIQKIQNGARYFVGQHGNNYGTHGLMSPTIEEITNADNR